MEECWNNRWQAQCEPIEGPLRRPLRWQKLPQGGCGYGEENLGTTSAARATSSGLPPTAQDWELNVDLGKQLKFPETVATTTLRLDLLLISEISKQIVLLELTILWEDRIKEASEKKRAKYTELVEECRNNG
ncbi:hypothetical protein SRHO_G00068480 [Serrasalmus rhombeus]